MTTTYLTINGQIGATKRGDKARGFKLVAARHGALDIFASNEVQAGRATGISTFDDAYEIYLTCFDIGIEPDCQPYRERAGWVVDVQWDN